MKKSNYNSLRFDTQKNARSTRTKRFVAAFSCFFVLLLTASVLLLLNYYDFDLSSIGKAPNEETTEETTMPAPAPTVTGTYNYLLLCTADTTNEVRFAVVLTADMDNLALSIQPLSTSASLTYAGFSGTPEQQLTSGGEQQLAAAVGSQLGIKIDYYIRSKDTDFKAIINTFGGFETTVKESLNIRTDTLTAIINSGKQSMTGDTLLKYLRCFESEPQKQAQIIADLLKQELTAQNLEKADTLYSKTINLIQTNISIIVFNQIKSNIEALLYNSANVNVYVK